MFNANKPSLEELPSAKQLLRSTIMAAIAAIAILVMVVLPAEYGIDPTGAGRLIGLTEMGEIKKELSEEAEQDRQQGGQTGQQSSLLQNLFGLIVSTAHAQSGAAWAEEVEFELDPGATNELKMTMTEGASVDYLMTVTGGRVNFDLHGHGGGNSITYEKGRGSTGSEGSFTAAFPGSHGWFWRNRDSKPVVVNVKLRGTYSDLKQGQ